MKKEKESILSPRKKALLFFGFYFIFFLVLTIFVRVQDKKLEKTKEEEENVEVVEDKNLYLENVLKMNYQYDIDILSSDEIIAFNGTNDNIDCEEYENKYFLNIFNINQLIKKSKVIEKIGNYGKYSLNNSELDKLLGTINSEGNTIIEVKEDSILEIDLDLHEYLKKEIYVIKIVYREGEKND